MNTFARLVELFNVEGMAQYGDEAVSQREHALQCAALAEAAGAPPTLITAALLHDIGHLVDKHFSDAAARGVDRRHEEIGAGFLATAFGPDVTEPVRLHVPAKRYLCAVEPGYRADLSFASERSLVLQGGPMTPDEVELWDAHPYARAAVSLRRWDDHAKIAGLRTPPLAHFLPMVRGCLVDRAGIAVI